MPFSDPKTIIKHFQLYEGMTVADFGTGSGAYALALARAVGREGRVYAIDIQKELLARLAREADTLGLRNIVEIIWSNLEEANGTKLADASVDFIVIANLLFQTSAKYTLVCEARRILRAGGQIALIDWSGSFGGLGPRPEEVLSPEEAKRIFLEAGFTFAKDFPAGDHHYGLMFSSPSSK